MKSVKKDKLSAECLLRKINCDAINYKTCFFNWTYCTIYFFSLRWSV